MRRTHVTRLAELRDILNKIGLEGFLIPRSDEHLGEYVASCSERLAFISGFTGSAGFAIVLADRAAIFSDGRYTLQLQSETNAALWERLHLIDNPPENWARAHAAGLRIGYDPWLISADGLKKFAGLNLIPVETNPIDEIWLDRPAEPMAAALPYDVRFAGEDAAVKRDRLAQTLKAEGQDAALLTDPASLAWLFNLRGSDLEFTPIALGFAILNADASATIFMASEKLPPETRTHLGNQVTIAPRAELPAAIAGLSGKRVRYDPAAMPIWFKTRLENVGAAIAEAPDPVALPRAQKNPVEQAGARAAHLRDGVAMARFLAWFCKAAQTGQETEVSVAAKLLQLRRQGAHFRGESFPAISGAGEHGAIIHYRVTSDSNRPIKPGEVFLIDSGAQYEDGTTDITRTMWTGPDAAPASIKDHFTRVLAGHIALATAVFPDGVAGPHLDCLARTNLWQAGLDYDHGTGHGVGAYLSVHEGPAGIARTAKLVALKSGMILSNEPGYYLPDAYGIRLENLVLVQPAEFSRAQRKFLRFETLTMAPFDRALIEPSLLPPSAVIWLNQYHTRVKDVLMPLLASAHEAETREWLEAATSPI